MTTTYRYSAISATGRTIRGELAAENVNDLEQRLGQIRLDLIEAKAKKERKTGTGGVFGRVRVKDIIIMCMHMEQLLRAAVPLNEALEDVRDSTESAKLRDILTGVCESVSGGQMLSKALGQYPRVFGSVFVGLVSSGEKTGNLNDSFAQLADHMKWTAEIRSKIKKATRYPAVLLVVITGVIAVMMLNVVPKLVDFIVNQGFTLPWHTKLLISVSGGFQEYWYLIFGIPIGLFVGIFLLRRLSEEFAYRFDKFALWMPVIGPVIRKVDMARFTHFFSVMFGSGIDILEALEAGKGVVRNRVLKESIEMVKLNVTSGNTLTSSLMISNQFPTLVVRMFKVGEDSGNMTEALENITFFYNREVNDSVDGLIGMIQPMLTVVMGVLIFWIIAAVFGPLYQSFSKMKF